jgi:hypothetical protein
MVCMNLSIGLTKVFKSTIGLGKDRDYVKGVERALEGFNDDEGYDVLRKKVVKATESWASLSEIDNAYQVIVALHNKGFIVRPDGSPIALEAKTGSEHDAEKGSEVGEFDQFTSPVMASFRKLLGNMTEDYGIAHLGALPTRRKQILPAKCSVYDVMNFMTEVGTHWTKVEGQRRCQAYVGNLLATDEYDLEGSRKKFGEFRDVFMDATRDAKTTAALVSASKPGKK